MDLSRLITHFVTPISVVFALGMSLKIAVIWQLVRKDGRMTKQRKLLLNGLNLKFKAR